MSKPTKKNTHPQRWKKTYNSTKVIKCPVCKKMVDGKRKTKGDEDVSDNHFVEIKGKHVKILCPDDPRWNP